MGDIVCRIPTCREPYDAYDVFHHGCMDKEEAKLFLEGEGCPSCHFGLICRNTDCGAKWKRSILGEQITGYLTEEHCEGYVSEEEEQKSRSGLGCPNCGFLEVPPPEDGEDYYKFYSQLADDPIFTETDDILDLMY